MSQAFVCLALALPGKGSSISKEKRMPLSQGLSLEVRPLTASDAESCDQIILSLPHYFGHEVGRLACAQAVRTSDGWVAVLGEHVVGFLTVEPHFATTLEITWMAVHADYRGQGIGRQLMSRLQQEAQIRGYRLLLVATLSPSVDDEGYAARRAFYQAVGLLPLQEVPLYWGVGSQPALLLVMPL